MSKFFKKVTLRAFFQCYVKRSWTEEGKGERKEQKVTKFPPSPFCCGLIFCGSSIFALDFFLRQPHFKPIYMLSNKSPLKN